jgi:predicted transcriptional regulator
MSGSITIAARVSRQTSRGLDKIAKATGRSKSWLIAQAVDSYVADEQDYLSRIEKALRDVREGRVTPHDRFVRDLKRRRRKR